jgi:hypothetical protein
MSTHLSVLFAAMTLMTATWFGAPALSVAGPSAKASCCACCDDHCGCCSGDVCVCPDCDCGTWCCAK